MLRSEPTVVRSDAEGRALVPVGSQDSNGAGACPSGTYHVRTEAVESLLVELGVIDTTRVDEIVRHYEEKVGPKGGARVVARAWIDPEFKKRLLADGLAACAELGLGGPETEKLHVVENSGSVHNALVCTLCSCYPWPILGVPPAWYKSSAYRTRMVREPRHLLAEMGLELDPSIEIRVWDSAGAIGRQGVHARNEQCVLLLQSGQGQWFRRTECRNGRRPKRRDVVLDQRVAVVVDRDPHAGQWMARGWPCARYGRAAANFFGLIWNVYSRKEM
jgi:nitrile hydratase